MNCDPKVSIVILNYEGMNYVEGCLDSVLHTNYPSFEVIFVDNASTDESLQYAKRRFGHDPRLKFVENDRNYGFSLGMNIGARHANGKYVVFLNNDLEVDANWLKESIKVMESDRTIGVIQPKLLLMNNHKRFNTCGHMLTPYGFLCGRGDGEVDEGQFDYLAEIFGANGAAMIVRREVLEEVGIFDPDYFLLWEETDLCWRVWLRGYRVVFVPNSVVYHDVGGWEKSTSEEPIVLAQQKAYHSFLGYRNSLITLMKNLEFKNLVKVIPSYILISLGVGLVQDLEAKVLTFPLIAKSIVWIISNFRQVIKKRLRVQYLIRKKTDAEIMPCIMVHPHIKISEAGFARVAFEKVAPNPETATSKASHKILI
jgi:hypothetical protein